MKKTLARIGFSLGMVMFTTSPIIMAYFGKWVLLGYVGIACLLCFVGEMVLLSD